MEAGEVGGGVDVHAAAGALEAGAEHRHHRALAVGAGDVDDRRQAALGVAEGGEQPLDAGEDEVDDLGVQRGQAVEDAVARLHQAGAFAASSGAGSSPWT